MLEVKNMSFHYVESRPVLRHMNFSLEEGEHLCVMGESGCGKSTLLKVVYGLYDIDQGSMTWKGEPILGPAYHLIPGMDYMKYVAQDFDLMPYTTVAENISKFLSRFYPEESRKRTEELLEVIEMTPFADRKVKNLSGGQKQRVAIARALAREPELLLLDEPFGLIDNFKKRSLRRMLFTYLKSKNITCIVATHDADDALSYADKMIAVKDGKIIASGTPGELYRAPGNAYVANLFEEANELSLNGESLLLYPHQIKIVDQAGIEAIVQKSYFKGSYWLIEAKIDDQIVFFKHHAHLEPGEHIYLKISYA